MFQEDDAPTALVSLVVGGIAGATLAVLLMPRTGPETRRALADRVPSLTPRPSASRDARARVPEPGLPSTRPPFQSGL